MQLQDLPKAMRPREKLLALGSQALTDVELLSVLLGSGLPGQSVLQLAQSLLDRFQGLAGLLHASPEHLRHTKGLGGLARRSQLLAVVELSRRALLQKHPKHLGVLNAAAAQAGWGKPLPAGRHRGIAQFMGYGSYSAAVAEVTVSGKGDVKIHRMVLATNCGHAVSLEQIARCEAMLAALLDRLEVGV